MKWIHDYQLFLFDFDGLLVNTEEIHYEAYKKMGLGRGVPITWDFNRYCQAAHYDADGLKEQIYTDFPALYLQEPVWSVLYAEKKRALLDLVEMGAVQLMSGVEKLLKTLEHHHIPRCVVTHSPPELIAIIRKQNPILNTIPMWITREQYTHPKPDPECYLKAISQFNVERIIGFEDTPRGLKALMGTKARPVLICKTQYPEIPSFLKKGVLHFPTLDNIHLD